MVNDINTIPKGYFQKIQCGICVRGKHPLADGYSGL